MLPPEIEPFADHHIAELDKVYEFLKFVELAKDNPTATISDEEILANINRLKDARNAFVRFKVCMVDEVKQKERLHAKALDCRLHHK